MPGLDDLFDAWDKTTGGGRDAEKARSICDKYIKANPADFADLEARFAELDGDSVQDVAIPEFVKLVDQRREAGRIFREQGMEAQAQVCADDELRIAVWVMHKFDPQNVGGTGRATVRIPR